MTIDKAIELLARRSESPFVRANPDTQAAMKMGVEALKYLKARGIVLVEGLKK